MDSSIARERLPSVVKPDSITASQGDFMVTHVAIKRLNLLNKFDIQPEHGKEYTEEQVFNKIILNKDNKHQFVVVYGQSGTGKSHTIRWFEARFEREKPDNEVVLFIKRSDNTLKGTIKQLLEKPEVQGIPNKDIYERLVKASAFVDENKLKDLIYHNFIVEIDNDDESHEITLNNVKRKRLKAFLNNEIVQDRMMSLEGPIERIYSKIAENSLVDPDTIAEFTPDDFRVSVQFFEDIDRAGADSKATRMAHALMADESGEEEAEKIALYLNQFVNDVIQRCAGIEPGDFRQIFQDIRKELFRLGKNLTLFIEDVTSFTGVDDALLDALIVEHTGMNEEEHLCRISSIVGTTNNYLQNNFRDNHKDRITQYIYIPDNVFDEDELFEFVGKYLNAMSVSEEKISEWVKNYDDPDSYPIHEVKEGKNWEYITDSAGRNLNLYPFTKNSIRYLYKHSLNSGHKTPRYIIRDIIEPVVNDILYNKENFPGIKCEIISMNQTLNYMVHNQVKDQLQSDRLWRLLSIWGDGSANQYTENGKTYIASISAEILEELNLPIISLDHVEVPEKKKEQDRNHKGVSEQTYEIEKPDKKDNEQSIPADKQKTFNNASALLTEWVGGKMIDISATVGTSRIIRTAIEDLISFAYSAVNWQAKGVSPDNIDKIKNKTIKLLALENQSKGAGHYMMPANWNSVYVIQAFIRWREFGNGSWNYPDADFDAYIATSWLKSVEDDLVKAVSDNNGPGKMNYIQAAITSRIYSLILNGETTGRSLRSVGIGDLFRKSVLSNDKNSHSKEWNALIEFMKHDGADEKNSKTVRDYFNLEQGSSSSVIVLNEPELSLTFKKVKESKLIVDDKKMENDDKVKQRNDVFAYLKNILSRVGNVATAEKEVAFRTISTICDYFGTDEDDPEIDEDDIRDLVSKAKQFYDEANNSMINISGGIPSDLLNKVKKTSGTIAKSINDISEVLDKEDILTVLMTFAGDPVSNLKILSELLQRLNDDMVKVERQLTNKRIKLGLKEDEPQHNSMYSDNLKVIDEDVGMLSGLRG